MLIVAARRGFIFEKDELEGIEEAKAARAVSKDVQRS